MQANYIYPFSAIVGQDMVKKALLLNAVNPSIGGVLISRERGTAKSTMVRGLAALLPNKKIVELPLNITEDRLIGTINIEKTIADGRPYFEPGILYQADGNILYVDEVNLLSDHIVNNLLDVSQSGINIIERESVSSSHPSKFILVGTMNPEEGFLRPQFLDRFGLFVEVSGEKEMNKRQQIISRRLDYEEGPKDFCSKFSKKNNRLQDQIKRGREQLKEVKVSKRTREIAVEFVVQGNCQGHRAEMILVKTARTIAALEERDYINLDDLKAAAEMVLPHRSRSQPPEKDSSLNEQKNPSNQDQRNEDIGDEMEDQSLEEEQENQSASNMNSQHQAEEEDHKNENNYAEENLEPDPGEQREKEKKIPPQDRIDEADEIFKIKPFQIKPFVKRKRNGSGRRTRTQVSSQIGRYTRYRLPEAKVKDLAFDATLRIAASKQQKRKSSDKLLVIKDSDLREKVREKKIGNTLLFVVDASGSMGANQRMKSKGCLPKKRPDRSGCLQKKES